MVLMESERRSKTVLACESTARVLCSEPVGILARLLPGQRFPTYEVLRGLADGTKAVYALGGSMSWRVARVDAT